MSEGLSATEVGQEIGRHASESRRHDRSLAIAEAVLLSIVTLAAGWSGYSAAKWNTESRIQLAQASAARTESSRAAAIALTDRNFDSSTFGAWFTAYTVGNQRAMRVAVRRFRPEFRLAFDAWRETRPETNPNAPKGPTYMPQYRETALLEAKALDAKADHYFDEGAIAGETSDKYIRITVFLASVLFLVGISTHFPYRGVRYALIGLGGVLLVAALVQLAMLPGPPA